MVLEQPFRIVQNDINMKKYIKSLVLAATMLSTTACDDYLKTTPTDFLSPAVYYNTEDQLKFALAGVYNTLISSPLYGAYMTYVLPWEADEGYMNRFALTSGPWNYFYTASDSYVAAVWAQLYTGIHRANILIENTDKNPSIPQTIRDKTKGEALFLRGYYYFLLVQHFGGVPILTKPTANISDVDVPRNSIKEVYDQIIEDMTTAETLVYSIKTLNFGGAVSKSAVRGVLARVNLTMAGYPLRDESRYAEARRWAKMVIDDTEAQHELNPSYSDVFKKLIGDQYDIKESIWEVEFRGNLTDSYNVTTLYGNYNGPTAPAGAASGRSDAYMSITAKLYNVFEPGDNRKYYCIPHFTYPNSTINGFKTMSNPPATEAAKYNLRPAKWRREYETLLPKAASRTPINVPLLRFSDVLLMYAEAENAISGPTSEAVEAINKVRRRSWSTGVKDITVVDPGNGYTSAPTVTFSSENGTAATATATIDIATGKLKSIVLNRDLAGIKFYDEGDYSTPPTITITGGGGSGAKATANIYTKSDADLHPDKYSTKDRFLETLQDERMRELNFESHRKGDLLRWGIFLKVYQEMADQTAFDSPGASFINYYKNVSERDLFMPIPISEMSVNRKMTQNPGW